jgi:hypothetical protein
VKQADRRGSVTPSSQRSGFADGAQLRKHLEHPRQDDTRPGIGGCGGDMSTPHKSLKYKAITLIA